MYGLILVNIAYQTLTILIFINQNNEVLAAFFKLALDSIYVALALVCLKILAAFSVVNDYFTSNAINRLKYFFIVLFVLTCCALAIGVFFPTLNRGYVKQCNLGYFKCIFCDVRFDLP
jgi:hypothetical protein